MAMFEFAVAMRMVVVQSLRFAVENVVAVDVRVPGCPPTPLALMRGILAAVNRT